MSEKHKRFMAELRPLLERYSAMLNPPMAPHVSWSACVVYADDDASEPGSMAPHFIYGEDGSWIMETPDAPTSANDHKGGCEMDTKQHGSGPWRVERRDPMIDLFHAAQFAVLDANDRKVAVVVRSALDRTVEDHSHPTTKGIAAKVAAAPELYGALCDALEKLELAADMIDNGWDWLAGEIDAAQEAIDKALNTRFEP